MINISLHDFWKKNKKFLISFIVVLFGGGSGTLIVGPEYIVNFFKAPLYYKEASIMTHEYEHYKEMWWEWGRLITDNWDSTIVYQIADDGGQIFEVDIRWVNGPNNSDIKIPIAFVGKPIYSPYPIHIANADGRMYINLSDNKSGEIQNVYLYKKQPKR